MWRCSWAVDMEWAETSLEVWAGSVWDVKWFRTWSRRRDGNLKKPLCCMKHEKKLMAFMKSLRILMVHRTSFGRTFHFLACLSWLAPRHKKCSHRSAFVIADVTYSSKNRYQPGRLRLVKRLEVLNTSCIHVRQAQACIKVVTKDFNMHAFFL